MEAVSDRIHAGLTWLTSSHGLRNLTIFDSLAVPFTDIHLSNLGGDTNRELGSSERVVFVDSSGHQMSEAEVESLERAAFSDSPWGFVASRYALTLGVMAVVVNRITHICRPQGRPRPLPGPRRLAIQLPTLFFLGWSGFLLLLVTLQSFSIGGGYLSKITSSTWIPADVQTLVKNSAVENDIHMANSALLWRLFLSVCFAVVSSTLLRTLEGHNTIVNPDDLGNFPTFNLVGFAVLLHLHASSYTFPPNKHVYLSILFQVGEVLGLQACTCWIVPPISRLSLTSFFGLTSTLHYLLAIHSGDRGYPFLQSFSRAPDVALIAVIALTLFLHALTAAITNTPLSFSRLIDPRSLPLPTEDYNLALFKLGTACLSSTRLSGLDSDLIDIRTLQDPWIEVDGGQIRVRAPDGSLAKPGRGARSGFKNEIRRIRAPMSQQQGQAGRHIFRSPKWRARWQFFVMLLNTLRGLAFWLGRKIVDILPFDLPAIQVPLWVTQVPRWIRLAWHGQNGEERRRLRQEDRRRQEQRRRQAMASDAVERDRLDGAGRAPAVSSSVTFNGDATGLRRRDRAFLPDNANESPNSWRTYFQQEFREEDEDEDEEWLEEDHLQNATTRLNVRQTTPAPASIILGENSSGDYWQQLGSGSRLIGNIDEGEDDDDDDDEDYGDDEDPQDDEVDLADMSAELLTLARREFDDESDAGQALSGGADQSAVSQDSYARILMAHMSSPNSKVLTRRGYRDLVGSRSRDDDDARLLADLIRQRRPAGSDALQPHAAAAAASSSSNSERERMRLCVICYVEDRTIICWPCKCLALCDSCREAMAARPPPRSAGRHHGGQAGGMDDFGGGGGTATATHTCPTCRTPVIGFSRIYLP